LIPSRNVTGYLHSKTTSARPFRSPPFAALIRQTKALPEWPGQTAPASILTKEVGEELRRAQAIPLVGYRQTGEKLFDAGV